MIFLLVMVALFALILIRTPIAFALALAGIVGLFLEIGPERSLSLIGGQPFAHSASYTLSSLPLFILMAEFLARSTIASDLFHATSLWLSRLRGGLAMATVGAGAGFGALSGSSTASAGALASIAVPRMREQGYDERISGGVTSSAGTLAVMIPPSIAMIIYGVQTETSIRGLFAAGLVPGIGTALAYFALIAAVVRRKPHLMPGARSVSWSSRFGSLKKVLPAVLLVGLVIIGIYSGVMTATEAGAVGAAAAFLLSVTVGKISWSDTKLALTETVHLTTAILIIVGGAAIFGSYVSLSGIARTLFTAIEDSPLPPTAVLSLVMLVYLILGMFMDQIAILLLTLPLAYPVIESLGFNAIWFGIVVVKTVEIGLATPPLGLNVYVTSAAAKIRLPVVVRGVLPFIVVDLVILAVLILFPGVVLFPLEFLLPPSE